MAHPAQGASHDQMQLWEEVSSILLSKKYVYGNAVIGPSKFMSVVCGSSRSGAGEQNELLDHDHLTITAYNIHPEGMEANAVETTYQRVKKENDTVR